MAFEKSFPSMRITGGVRRLVLVFGDQLNTDSAAFDDFDSDTDGVLMMEVEEESTHVPSHVQRTILFLAAMRHFAIDLADRRINVQYVRLNDPHNSQCFESELERQIKRLEPQTIRCVCPGEWRVRTMVVDLAERLSVGLEMCVDRHFLITPDEFTQWAEGRKSLVMEHFYRTMRKRLGLLVDSDGEPEGGRWNFDPENRDAFKSAPSIRTPYRAQPDDVTREVIDLVQRRLPDLPGRIDTFEWPVTRAEAKRALADFIEHRLPDFGRYQDAMWIGEPTVYHSRLSVALNLKLLRPLECVDAAIDAYQAGNAPIQSVEAFVRQIIGWREFIRGVYWHMGPTYANRNALDHQQPLPDCYWTGETDMRCMKEAIGQVLETAHGHHIQRLMITGNFALLLGVEPQQVCDWYLGMYADAVDWVSLPNTLGMALHADGGIVGTKPYVSTGKYIKRMSNYCEGCRFDPEKRTGDDACPFTTLYWDFLSRHRTRLKGNQRMQLQIRNLDRISRTERRSIRERANELRSALDPAG